MGLYIVANIDGHVISSTDGINWTEPFDTGIGIGKVAIGPNKIVYTGAGEGGEGSAGLYYASAWNQTPVLVEATDQYHYNEVHYLGDKFVAVGYQVGSQTFPAFAYSEDGVDWTIGQIDPGYVMVGGGEGGEGNQFEFTDVGYNGTGYFITSRISGESLASGFYVTDLSQELNETNWVNIENFPVDANQLVYSETPEGGESGFAGWSAFSDDQKTWFSTTNSDPSQPWSFFGSGGEGWDLTQILFDQTGLNGLSITEATIGILEGYVTWMLSTTSGQIIWWPHVPAGPFVSVPNPFTTTVNSVNNLNPLEVNISGDNLPINNEKIKIEGSTGLAIDGVYFVESLGSGNYRVYSDLDLENVIDASGLSGTYGAGSGTVVMSRGTYIDALGYGDGKFFAGNDDEEVFVCSSFGEGDLVWTKVDDQNNSFVYWNDVSYGDFDGCSTSYSYELSPDNPETIPNYRFYGEGNMDTSIVIEDGKRRSLQRTGYFDYLDGCGNRKVMRIDDGDVITDSPDSPEANYNPNGHPTFGANDNPAITEQVIPVGNPLAS